MDAFASICAGAVAGYLVFAAVAKLLSVQITLRGFAQNRWRPAWLFFLVFVASELIATALLFASPQLGAYVATALLAVYFLGEAYIAARQPGMVCWCYGSVSQPTTAKGLWISGPMLTASIIATGIEDQVFPLEIAAAIVVFTFGMVWRARQNTQFST